VFARRISRALRALAFAVALPIALSRAAMAQQRSDAQLDSLTRSVASQLRCPVCQGESILDSPASLAQEMRTLVRTQLAAGKTPDEVKAYFVSKYGEWILLAPPASGFTLLVYALPIGALLLGAGIVFFAVRRWTNVPDDDERQNALKSGPGTDASP
jgi:cytochrome c-type biogenesis protein CcmH